MCPCESHFIHSYCLLLQRAPQAFLPQPPDLAWNNAKSIHALHWKLLPVVDCCRFWFCRAESFQCFHQILSATNGIVCLSVLYCRFTENLVNLTTVFSLFSLAMRELLISAVNSAQVVPALCLVMYVCGWILLQRVWLQLHLSRWVSFSVKYFFHFLKVCVKP